MNDRTEPMLSADSMKNAKNAASCKERYNWLKAHGICVKCGQESAYKGLVTCIFCRAVSNASALEYRRNHKLTPDQLEANRIRNQELKNKRKQMGLCPKCGKQPMPGHVHCGLCLAKDRERSAQKRLMRGILPRDVAVGMGLCACCLKNPVMPDKKVCESCYPVYVERAKNARKHINYTDHVFRMLNKSIYDQSNG